MSINTQHWNTAEDDPHYLATCVIDCINEALGFAYPLIRAEVRQKMGRAAQKDAAEAVAALRAALTRYKQVQEYTDRTEVDCG